MSTLAELHDELNQHSVKALPDLGGIDATAAATQKLGDVRTRFDGLHLQLVAAFKRYDETVALNEAHGIEARFKMSPPLEAAYAEWKDRGAVEQRVELANVSPAPLPPEEPAP